MEIREERQRLHLTQAQLAEDVDISDTYMGAIERGERSLTLDTLVRLVNRLGVTVDYLLADSVTGSDEAVLDEFKQIVDNQPLEPPGATDDLCLLRERGDISPYAPGTFPFRSPRTISTSLSSRFTASSASFSTGIVYSAARVWSLS